MWCIPTASAEYVARMEAILDLYEQEYDPKRPLVCFDEGLKQLISETRPRITAQPGRIERYDYEYQRHGVRNLNMFFEPFAGQRHVRPTKRRTKQDFAENMRWLVDEVHPEAELIDLIQDNLNTHTAAALYETFPPAEARRILKKLVFHYTPKHGSWLNMAEIELGVFGRRVKEYIPDDALLNTELEAITTERNHHQATVDWRFRTDDARIKLKRLYPSLSD